MARPWGSAAGAGMLATALLLSACGGGGDSDSTSADGGTDSADEGCTTERAGGSVTMAMGTQPTGLDPSAINGSPSTGAIEVVQIYDALMQYNKETAEYEPRVAESLEPNDAFDEWTLTLRPDVTFGNGDPLDAEAVKASLVRSQSDANKSTYRNLARQITDITVEDASTLVLTLEQPWAGFPFTLANTPGMIVNTAVAEAAGEGFALNPTGAGVGPYEVDSFAVGDELVLKAKDDYWGGEVCIKELRFIPVTQDSAAYDAFQAGEVQAAWLRTPLIVAQTQDDDVEGILTYQNAANVVIMNAGVRGSTPPTTDVRVRQAVAHAIDVDAVDQRADEGTGQPTTAILGDNSAYYSGATGPEFDRELATEKLEEAKADGYDGSIRLICPSSKAEQGLALEAQLEAAGFDVALEQVANISDLVAAVIVRADYDLACFGLNILDEGLWPTLTNSLASDSPSNYSGYVDPRADELLDELRVASSKDEISDVMAELQDVWNDTVPAVILNSSPNRTIHVDELKGLQSTSNSLIFYADAYLAE